MAVVLAVIVFGATVAVVERDPGRQSVFVATTLLVGLFFVAVLLSVLATPDIQVTDSGILLPYSKAVDVFRDRPRPFLPFAELHSCHMNEEEPPLPALDFLMLLTKSGRTVVVWKRLVPDLAELAAALRTSGVKVYPTKGVHDEVSELVGLSTSRP